MNFRTIKRNRKWKSDCGNFVIERMQEMEAASHMYVCTFRGAKFAIKSFLSEARHACSSFGASS